MYTREGILAYRCPRWNDWPNLDLYMDQVVGLIESHVSLFYGSNQPKPVTSTMINNYVKQHLVPPSRKKKYGRDHLAQFYIIFLLKSALGLMDISDALAYVNRSSSTEETFNLFCDEIESALAVAFGGTPPVRQTVNPGVEMIRSLTLAFAYILLARHNFATNSATPSPAP